MPVIVTVEVTLPPAAIAAGLVAASVNVAGGGGATAVTVSMAVPVAGA